jgi:glycosyltransferase involved in cell wall biosynthesis
MPEQPLVSVCMITYRHEAYIAEAIEGVLMQTTDFPYELVIADDCSPDRTGEICDAYERKYPVVIRLLRRKKNFGMMPNFVDALKNCQGKYKSIFWKRIRISPSAFTTRKFCTRTAVF